MGWRSFLLVMMSFVAFIGSAHASEEAEQHLAEQLTGMKAELEAMRHELAPSAESSEASGMRSMRKNATVSIGGKFETRYRLGWIQDASGPKNNGGANIGDATVYTYSGWDVKRAEVDLGIEFTPDVMALVEFRFDQEGINQPAGSIIDHLFWSWANVGGSDFVLSVGLQDMPFGQDEHGCSISDAYTHGSSTTYGDDGLYRGWRNSTGLVNALRPGLCNNITEIGVRVDYVVRDFSISAGVMQAPYSGFSLQDADWQAGSLWTNGNAVRNNGWTNVALQVAWDPAAFEGLHLEASYVGFYDAGQGSQAWQGGANYNPNFSTAFKYQGQCWSLYGEYLYQMNPGFFKNSYAHIFSLGSEYDVNGALSLSGQFDMALLKGGSYGDWAQTNVNARIAPQTYEQHIRAMLAAKYDFGNGIYVQAEYSHTWYNGWGFGNSDTLHADVVQVVTGVSF